MIFSGFGFLAKFVVVLRNKKIRQREGDSGKERELIKDGVCLRSALVKIVYYCDKDCQREACANRNKTCKRY